MDPIDVLLATFNGEKYLREQIDSILAQDYRNLRILARDDGSHDATPEILEEYARRFPQKLQVIATGEPAGSPKRNFEKLMEASRAPYVMFSDQDDVWDTDKASASVAILRRLEAQHGGEGPLLVFTDLTVVDPGLDEVNQSYWKFHDIHPAAIHQLAWLLRHNAAPGCTMLINRPLLQLALPIAQEAQMHDWWIALLANIFGHYSYLALSTIRYRHHAANALAAGPDQVPSGIWLVRNQETRSRTGYTSQPQAEALLRLHGRAMPARKRIIVRAFLQWGAVRTGARSLARRFQRPSTAA